MSTASARPERLTNLAETVAAIVDGLGTRAGWLDDDWVTYSLRNGRDWRFDFGDLPDAIRAWASTLGSIGAWTGRVGEAFLEAGSGDGGDVHRVDERRLHELLPRADRTIIERSDADDYTDWGDPDDPPDWLEALDFTAMAVGHVGSGVDALEVTYVVGIGSAATWSPATPALLGEFATASSMAKFATLFGLGSAGLSGAAAGLTQWHDEAGTLNYTDAEAAARAAARGIGTSGAALGGSALGSGLAGYACVSAGPVCAGLVIIGTSLAVSGAANWALDLFLDSPGPAEHDPDMVRDAIEGVAPDALLRDIPDEAWEVMEPVHDAGEEAGEAAYESRHPYLDRGDLHADPGMIEHYDLPLPWVDDHMSPLYGPGWTMRYDTSHRPLDSLPEVTPEMQAAIDRYVATADQP